MLLFVEQLRDGHAHGRFSFHFRRPKVVVGSKVDFTSSVLVLKSESRAPPDAELFQRRVLIGEVEKPTTAPDHFDIQIVEMQQVEPMHGHVNKMAYGGTWKQNDDFSFLSRGEFHFDKKELVE